MAKSDWAVMGAMIASLGGAMAEAQLVPVPAPAGRVLADEPVQYRQPRVPQRLDSHEHRGAGHAHGGQGHAHGGGDAHGIETESLFGFVLGSDTDSRGSRAVALETIVRAGRGGGRFIAAGQRLEFAYGVTDDFSVSIAALGAYHDIRDVPDLMDRRAYAFAGIGGELRWRLLRRSETGFGLTLHAEPRVSVVDEISGQRGRGLASENKLIIDTELVRERVFAAFNLIYDVERFRERGAEETERASTAGVGLAITAAVGEGVFLGAEARYLRAYEGYGLDRFQGQALYLGPTLHWRFGAGYLSASWNVQVWGRPALDGAAIAEALAVDDFDTAAALSARPRLDLANFDRHQVRVKLGFEF